MTVNTLFIYDAHEKYKGILSNLNSSMCPFFKDNRYSRLDNSAETLEFTTLLSHPSGAPDSAEEEGYIVFKDDDGEFVKYKIIKVEEDRIKRTKTILAVGSWIELTKELLNPFTQTNLTAKQHLEKILSGTNWRVGTVEYNGVRTLSSDKMISVLEATQRIKTVFKFELRFRVEVKHNKITGHYCDILERRGKRYERRFEVKKDVIGLRRIVDTTDLVTALYGFGEQDPETTSNTDEPLDFSSVQWSVKNGDPVDKPIGQKWVGNPYAVVKYSKDGKHLFGIHESTVKGDPYLLLQKTWEVLKRRSMPKLTYEVDLALLEGVGVGDTITIHDLTDEEKPMIVEARVLEKEGPITESNKGKVILGNYRELQKVDITETLQDQLRKYATKVQVESQLNATKTYIDGAFADGLVNEAEAKAIEKYLNSLSVEKADVYAKYTEIYTHKDLTNTTIKTDLSNKRVAYNRAFSNLIYSINTAIADGKTTLTEKQDVDSKFASYRTALANLTTTFEKALTSISQKQADTAKEGAKNDVQGGIVPLPTGALNGSISSSRNNIVGGGNELLVQTEGVLSVFNFTTAGVFWGWVPAGFIGESDTRHHPVTIRFYIPQNFKVVSAELHAEQMHRKIYRFEEDGGRLLRNEWFRYARLYKANSPSHQNAFSYPIGEIYIDWSRLDLLDITNQVWGGVWNPEPLSPEDGTIKRKVGNITRFINTGYNEFQAKATEDYELGNSAYMRLTAIIKGYQK